MDIEVIFSEGIGTVDYRSADVGTLNDRVHIHLEDNDGAVEVDLTAGEAYALMAALGQAVRAL